MRKPSELVLEAAIYWKNYTTSTLQALEYQRTHRIMITTTEKSLEKSIEDYLEKSIIDKLTIGQAHSEWTDDCYIEITGWSEEMIDIAEKLLKEAGWSTGAAIKAWDCYEYLWVFPSLGHFRGSLSWFQRFLRSNDY